MHLSGLGTGLNIPSWQKSGSCIHNHSQTALSTSPLCYNSWPTVLLQRSELHYRFLCLSSQMLYMPHRLSIAYFHHDRIFKLVTRWGKCISIDGEYDYKWWFMGRKFDVYLKLRWFFSCAKEQRIGPVRQSLNIHSLCHSFLFADGRFLTVSLWGANTVSPFSGTETMW